MIVIPGRIPVAIHPIFWLFAALIGWLNSQSLLGTLVWVAIIFVSVLFHEFGHAITAVLFKQKTKIQLVALGGVTSYDGPKLRFWQQFIVVFNGPLFGFFLFLLATVLLQFNWGPPFQSVLRLTQLANLFWTVVNLLPIMPLDGGQLLRIVLEAIFGIKGFKAALLIGSIISALFALYFFLVQGFLIGALFFLFAFQGFVSWRQSRFATKSDRDDENRQLLLRAETAFQDGRKQEARGLFEQLREKTGAGLFADVASQYLALLDSQEGKRQEAYDLLLPIQEHLSPESRLLFHQLASEQKNYEAVAKISAECYQFAPTREVALRNARAFAHLGQAKLAGGWLQTAVQHGGLDLKKVLEEEEFLALKDDPDFKEFI